MLEKLPAIERMTGMLWRKYHDIETVRQHIDSVFHKRFERSSK